MAIRSITQLKTWFRKGAYPLASQFADWMDSYWHKDEKIPIDAVDQLADRLNGKYDAAQANELQKQVENAVRKTNAVEEDVATLFTNIEELEAEDERLDGRITSGDEATLQSANDHTDTAIAEERVVRESAERTTLESAKSYADQKIAEVVGGSPEALDTLQELAGALGDDPNFAATIASQIGKKVDKVDGKGLSTEDFTTEEKAKLAGIAAGANNYTHPTSHSADMIEQNENRRFVSDAEKEAWNNKAEPVALHPVSYAELVAFRNDGKLRPGHHYRITDFVTTVANDAEARSVGHPFDIIVLATAADTLSEEARAIANENYAEYFATANLSAWKVWYCLDNDTTRFQWADETNGRGVIYRLIDEWQNDCPYDFKNVQFKRYRVVDESPSGELQDLDGQYIGTNSEMQHLGIDESEFVWAYTFSFGDRYSAPTDASLIGFNRSDIGEGYGDKGHYGDNIILPCTCHLTVDNDQNSVFCLNNIVWFTNNVLHRALISGNRIDGECINMTLSGHGTHIKHDCRNIITGDGCYANTFGVCCSSITLGPSCGGNTFGNYCFNNSFGNGCYWNTFGNNCWYNSFGNYCSNNSFGNNCGGNTFGNDFRYNTFGNYCFNNSFGNYLRYITVNDDVRCASVVGGTSSSSYVQNAQILNGTSGSSSSNRLQISFKANVEYCQFAGLNSSGILKIWTPADLV